MKHCVTIGRLGESGLRTVFELDFAENPSRVPVDAVLAEFARHRDDLESGRANLENISWWLCRAGQRSVDRAHTGCDDD